MLGFAAAERLRVVVVAAGRRQRVGAPRVVAQHVPGGEPAAVAAAAAEQYGAKETDTSH